MSGGHFNYDQHKIHNIADEIENILEKQGQEKQDSYYTYSDGVSRFPVFNKEIQDKFKEAIYHLRKAAIYTERIDFFLSGDDGEESFLKRLNEDLKKVEDTPITIKDDYCATINGEFLNLTKSEFQILKLLMDKEGQALSRKQIYKTLWGYYPTEEAEKVVDVHIHNLRKKIKVNCIKTIKNVGFKYTPNI